MREKSINPSFQNISNYRPQLIKWLAPNQYHYGYHPGNLLKFKKSKRPKYCTRTLYTFMVPEAHNREEKNIWRGKKSEPGMAVESHTSVCKLQEQERILLHSPKY